MRFPFILAIALATLPCVPVAAQEQAPQEQAPQGPTFRTGVDLISIDVSAVDSRGRPVDGLLAPEFSVKVDGQPRRVVSVQQVKYGYSPVPAGTRRPRVDVGKVETFYSTNITPPEGRLIVFAVDETNIDPGNVRPLLNAAADFIDRLNPSDRVAFYAFPQPATYVDFTSDRPRIRRAMERVVGSQTPEQTRFNIGISEATQAVLNQDEVTQETVSARECQRSVATNRNVCAQEAMTEMGRIVARLREERSGSLLGLQDLLLRLSLVEGPKTLVLVSDGLILEGAADLDDVTRMAAIGRVSVHAVTVEVQRGSESVQAESPTTIVEDRQLRAEGLRQLAYASGGALYTVIGNGEAVFDRLGFEISSNYVLGIEVDPRDRDDRNHRIDVEVRRIGVSLRSHRAFVLAAPRSKPPEQRLSDVLASPLGVPGLPLRITTFAIPNGTSPKVRLLLAADVGQAGTTAGEYTMGWVLFDREGRIASSASQKATLQPVDGRKDSPLGFLAPVDVDPGVYWLRFAVVDSAGRQGSVVREVNAWKIQGEEFAVGDLIVAAAPPPGQPVMPHVEPYVSQNLVAVLDMHATLPETLERSSVTFEIAADPDAPALRTAQGVIIPASQPSSKLAQALMDSRALPAGNYVVRARIVREGRVTGILSRPFLVVPPEIDPSAAPIPPPKLPIPRFERPTVLAPPVLASILASLPARSAALAGAAAQAQKGEFAGAAMDALSAGDQAAAAFLKGLDWFAKGELNQAASQLNIAAGPRREFFPAAFYLGATYAAAGRDRDAASIWQMSFGTELRPSLAYQLFADARFRDGQPQSVVDVLKSVWPKLPNDDEITRRLATAYMMLEQHRETLDVLVPFLERHPDDQPALFAAIVSQYEAASRAKVSLSNLEKERMRTWARRYRGDQSALVDRYLQAVQAR